MVFIYRGAVLHNKLPVSLRTETKLPIFKTRLKEWVKANIAMKPKSIFASISTGYRNNRPPPPPPPKPPPSTSTRRITQYFAPTRPSMTKIPRNQDNLTTSTVCGSSRMMSLHHYFPPAQRVRVQQVGAAHHDQNG